MYSLDVNFLNDRPEYKPDVAKRSGRGGGVAIGGRRPLWIGLGVGLLLPLLTLASLLFLQNSNNALREDSAELDSQLQELQKQEAELKRLEADVKQAKDEATALATVFNQVKPWSALMQDLRDRIPPNVQITSVKQVAAPVPAAGRSPSPSPTAPTAVPPTYLEIIGKAKDFNDVNDLALMLERSPLVDGKAVQILGAKREAQEKPLAPLTLPNQPQQAQTSDQQVRLPKLIDFSIRAGLTEMPASEMVDVLNAKGAKGLVTRLRVLQQKGVGQTPAKPQQKPAGAQTAEPKKTN